MFLSENHPLSCLKLYPRTGWPRWSSSRGDEPWTQNKTSLREHEPTGWWWRISIKKSSRGAIWKTKDSVLILFVFIKLIKPVCITWLKSNLMTRKWPWTRQLEIEREREHQLSLETLKLKQKAYHARVQGKISRIWFATKTKKLAFLETIRKEAELEKQEGERHHRQRVRSEVKRLFYFDSW